MAIGYKSVGSQVLESAGVQVFAELFLRFAKFAFIIIIIRYIGVRDWGFFSYILTYLAVYFVAIDFGIDTLVTRYVSSGNTKMGQLLLSTKLLFVVGTLLVVAVGIVMDPSLQGHVLVVALLALCLLSDEIKSMIGGINRGFLNIVIESRAKVLTSSAFVVVGVPIMVVYPNALGVALVYTLSSCLGLWYMVRRSRGFVSQIGKLQFRWADISHCVPTLIPYLLMYGYMTLIGQSDILFIRHFYDFAHVGEYSALQRIYQFISSLIPIAALAIFPFLSQITDRARERRIFEKSIAACFLFALPITVLGATYYNQIGQLLYPTLPHSSYGVLGILLCNVVGFAVWTILYYYYMAGDTYRQYVNILGGVSVLNLLANAVVVPRYGLMGSAWVVCGSFVAVGVFGLYDIWRTLRFSLWKQLPSILVASIVMALGVEFATKLHAPVVITCLGSLCAYFITLVVTRSPITTDILALLTEKLPKAF